MERTAYGGSVPALWKQRFLAPERTLPRWARDRPERAIYRSDEGGKWEIFGWTVGTPTGHPLTDRPEGTDTAGLSPDGQTIWWFDDEAGSEFGTWMRQPFDGGQEPIRADLPPAYATGLALGQSVAVVGLTGSSGSSIYRLGQTAGLLYQHRQLASVVSINRNERLVLIQHTEHGDARRPALRVIDLNGTPVAELWDGPELAVTGGDWSPVPGDDRVIFHHQRHDHTSPALWEPRAGEQQELALGLQGEIEASWFPDGRRLLLLQVERGRTALWAYDLHGGGLEQVMPPAGTIDPARVRPDGEIWCRWSSGADPPRLIRLPGREPLLAEPITPPAGVPLEDVDAGAVHALLARPPGPPPYPAIFLIHGGPEAYSADNYSPRAQAWVDHGYAVVLVNYRGSTGYGRAWTDAIVGRPGLTELEDIKAVRDLLVTGGVVDPGRIILAGRSWGGYLTLLGLGTQPDSWSLGIADVPVGDYFLAYEDEMEPLQASDAALFGGTPTEVPERYRESSPISYADRVRVPVFITGGLNDPRCPIRQVEAYVSRLQALGKQHEYYRYEAGHRSLRVEEEIRQEAMKLGFAARHLCTPEPMD